MIYDGAARVMHRAAWLAAMLPFAALLAVWPGAGRAQPAAGQPIAVGLSNAMTGQFALDGRWMREGVELAIKEINASGGIKGRPLQLFVEDDQGPNPTAAGNAVTKLATQDHVVAMIGPHYSPAILGVEPLLANYQVPALSAASGPLVTAQGNKFVFRMRVNDNVIGALYVHYLIHDLHWQNIGIDYVNTAFGQGGFGALKAELDAEHVAPLAVQTHLDSTKDFTPQLLAFKQAGVKGLILWSDDVPTSLLCKQIRTLGLDFEIAGQASLQAPNVFALSGDAIEGAYAIGEYISNNPDPVVQDWVKRYHAAYGADPELFASVYYDAANVLAAAMKRATEMTGPAIQKALTGTTGFRGVITTYTWSPGGDMAHSALITHNEHQKPVIVKIVSEQHD
jgi:branched-chain amino acid transport system substrate-binding protein